MNNNNLIVIFILLLILVYVINFNTLERFSEECKAVFRPLRDQDQDKDRGNPFKIRRTTGPTDGWKCRT